MPAQASLSLLLLPELDWVTREEVLLISLHIAVLRVWSWGQQHHLRASQKCRFSGSTPDPLKQSTEVAAHSLGVLMPGICKPCVPEAQEEDASIYHVQLCCCHPVVGSWNSPSFPSNSKLFVWDILPDTPSWTHTRFPGGHIPNGFAGPRSAHSNAGRGACAPLTGCSLSTTLAPTTDEGTHMSYSLSSLN